MTENAFIDTNIWIYAHLQEGNAPRSGKALDLLNSLPILVSSTQVLHEYYSVMLKYKINDSIIQDNIETIISSSEIKLIDIEVIRLAHKVRLHQRFSYWDSLIVASAIYSGCQTLYTEDLQHEQCIDQLIIKNPFINN